jgi:outer membrane lipoprotein carrier protein
MKYPIIIALVALLTLTTTTTFAQRAELTRKAQQVLEEAARPEQSDPEARILLDKVKQKYEAFKSLQVDFKVKMDDGKTQTEEAGTAAMQGNMYKIEMKEQDMICNGNTVWVHLKTNKEVQINNPEKESETINSPADMLRFYEKKMIYGIVDEVEENGKIIVKMELKPIDRKADFTKMRVSIDKTTYSIYDVTTFFRDASKYTVRFSNLRTNTPFAASYFTFDAAKYPDARIEDLRID